MAIAKPEEFRDNELRVQQLVEEISHILRSRPSEVRSPLGATFVFKPTEAFSTMQDVVELFRAEGWTVNVFYGDHRDPVASMRINL